MGFNNDIQKLVALGCLLLSTSVFATDPDNVALVAGAPAPYSGILFPLARAQRVELMSIDLDTANKRLDLATQDKALYQQRVDNLTAEVTHLSESNAKSNTFLSQYGMFFLGIASAVATAFAVSHATR